MRASLFGLVLISVACSTPKEATRGEPVDVAAADAKWTGAKLHEASALGRDVSHRPPPPAEQVLPPTRAESIVEKLHGVEVADPYRWLEDEKAAEVQAWMKAQDAYARERLAKTPGRDWLLKRYAELYYIESISAPVKRNGRYFYLRQHKNKEKKVVWWRQGPNGPEKVLLDPNTWSPDGTVSLGFFVPSPDGKKVAFSKKPNAADESILYVKDVDSGQVSDIDVISGAKYASPSWTPDSQGFYYEWLPTDPSIPVAERPGYTEIRYHRLGQNPAGDERVRDKTGDPKTFQFAALSRDGKHLFVEVWRGWTENDVYWKRVGKDSGFKLLVQGKGAKYEAQAWKNALYVMTDEGAPNKRIFKVDPQRPERARWKEIIPEDKAANIDAWAIVGHHLAVSYLKNAASEIRLYTLEGKPVRTIELPGVGTASSLIGLEDDDEAFYVYSSFTQPAEVYRISVKTGKSEIWSKVELPIDPTPYTVEQVFYPSKDGTRVSMFIVRRKDLAKDGSHHALLYGYGGFDISLTPSFSSFIYPWLESGGLYAVPNLRGGGEYGKAWHDAGRLHNRQNVFDDFIAAAEYLVKEGYTSPAKLAIRGGSNGGLLVGAAMTQRPDLFGAVICAVPLLDMVRYHRFGSGKTWIPEYGDPDKPEDFEVLFRYSPYHRVKKGERYPPLLVLSADHDDRVDPMHARKFVAAIQAFSQSGQPAYLRIETNAGHGGADLVKKSIESSADQLGFLFQTLSVSPPAFAGPTAAP